MYTKNKQTNKHSKKKKKNLPHETGRYVSLPLSLCLTAKKVEVDAATHIHTHTRTGEKSPSFGRRRRSSHVTVQVHHNSGTKNEQQAAE